MRIIDLADYRVRRANDKSYLDEALEHIDQGRPESAVVCLEGHYDLGYLEACVMIAAVYIRELPDTYENREHARRWLMRGLEEAGGLECNSSIERQCYYSIGILAVSGHIEAGSFDDGISYLEIGAKDDPLSMAMLAKMYLEGSIIEMNLQRAEELARLAATSEFLFPRLILSKVMLRRGHLFFAIKERIKLLFDAWKLFQNDINDFRLVHYISEEQRNKLLALRASKQSSG